MKNVMSYEVSFVTAIKCLCLLTSVFFLKIQYNLMSNLKKTYLEKSSFDTFIAFIIEILIGTINCSISELPPIVQSYRRSFSFTGTDIGTKNNVNVMRDHFNSLQMPSLVVTNQGAAPE